METTFKPVQYVLVEHRSWHLPPERRDAERSYYMGHVLDNGTVRILFPLYAVSTNPDRQQQVGEDWIAHPAKIEAYLKANTKLWDDPEYRAAWDKAHATTPKARKRKAVEVEPKDATPDPVVAESQAAAWRAVTAKPGRPASELGTALVTALDNDRRKGMIGGHKEDCDG
jgi:hypothetical protein